MSDDHLRAAFARAAADPGDDGRRSWEDVVRRSRRRRLAFGLRGLSRGSLGVPAVALPIALVIVFAAVRPGGGSSVGGRVVGAAGEPAPGSVLYIRQVIKRASPLPRCTRVVETWTSADGNRRRVLDTMGSWQSDTSSVVGPDGQAKLYDPSTNQVVVDSTYERNAGMFLTDDVVLAIRAALRTGYGRVVAHTHLGGHPALVVEWPEEKGVVNRWTVDAATYRPLRVVEQQHLYRMRRVIRYTAYEWLAPGPASEALLDTAANHPAATVRETTLDEQNDGGFGDLPKDNPSPRAWPCGVPVAHPVR